MRTSILYAALQATTFGLLITGALAQTNTAAAPGAITTLECYSDPGPLVKNNNNQFQTSGECQKSCGTTLQKAVMAITGGSTCYCGDQLPPLDKQVDLSKCNSPCQGFGTQTCGGIGYWQVYLTGVTGDVQTAPNSTTSSAGPSGTNGGASHSAETVVVTASSSSNANGGGGPNKVGIAVGVVVGVVAIAALIGAGIFYIKQKQRREIEEEHKAQAAINSFVSSHNSDPKSDSRLDPSMASSYRRESIGSIADERDFSRKILQVRNPDRGSMQSVA